MSIKEVLLAERTRALREKDVMSKTMVGMVLAEIKQYEVDNRKNGEVPEINDDVVIAILKTMVRQREKNMKDFPLKELIEKETAEIAILSKYLPTKLSEEDVIKYIRDEIAKLSNPQFKDVMLAIKSHLNGKADMKFVSDFVKKELA